jgi:hypothetical protein
MHIPDLQKTVDEARKKGTVVRALAVINPGNPTGMLYTCLLHILILVINISYTIREIYIV